MALLMKSWPCMEGANDFARRLKISFLLVFTKFLHLVMSSRDIEGFASLLSCVRLLAITTVLQEKGVLGDKICFVCYVLT